MRELFTRDMMVQLWWVFTNGILYYAEVDFLLRFWRRPNRKLIPPYMALNVLLTIVAIWTQMFFVFGVLHLVLLFAFSISCFQVSPKCVITPVVIIFTLSTFREGFVAVFMRFLSSTLTSQTVGAFFQFALPLLLAVLFFAALRLIAKRYPLMNQHFVSSYLYMLLLPSTLIIGGVRTSLGLDRLAGSVGHGPLLAGEMQSALSATLWMMGTLVVFFIILEVFHKITLLSQQETQRVLLASEIKEQRTYIEEARQRNEGYRSFQHDINNHLLVLSGLIHAQEYQQAAAYLEKLNLSASGLSEGISTGNSVLDVLLWEKIRYAKQCNITVTCDVQIPKESLIEDIDLCILFANGMDNAIKACMDAALEDRTITLAAKPKHTFLLIDMVNRVSGTAPLFYGTGLKNIELTAKKYAGAMNTSQSDHQFSLSILLCYKRISGSGDLCPDQHR